MFGSHYDTALNPRLRHIGRYRYEIYEELAGSMAHYRQIGIAAVGHLGREINLKFLRPRRIVVVAAHCFLMVNSLPSALISQPCEEPPLTLLLVLLICIFRPRQVERFQTSDMS